MSELADNPVLVVTFVTWLIAESVKFTGRFLTGSPARFGDTGGMPSGHAAFVSAAATLIGLEDGFDGPLFALAVVLVAIVLHDAVRLRWAVGDQAVLLNRLLKQSKLGLSPAVVWRGHRIREVLAGSLFGIIVSSLLYWWWYG